MRRTVALADGGTTIYIHLQGCLRILLSSTRTYQYMEGLVPLGAYRGMEMEAPQAIIRSITEFRTNVSCNATIP